MVAATEAATEAAATQGAQATEVAMLLRGVAVQDPEQALATGFSPPREGPYFVDILQLC